MDTAQRGGLPVVIRSPAWMRWVGVPAMVLLWVLFLTPVLAVLRREPGATLAGGSGTGTAVVGWVVVLVVLVAVPPSVVVVLRHRVVLDRDGVVPSRGSARVPLSRLTRLVYVPRSRVGGANRPDRLEVRADEGALVATISAEDRSWGAAREVLAGWAVHRPGIVADTATTAVLAGTPLDEVGPPHPA